MGVVGGEVHADALVARHVGGVLDEEAVEADGRATRDGTDKGVLQQAYIVLVDIHVGEAVLEHSGEDVARVEQVVHARAALSQYDGLVGLGVLAIDVARDDLVDRDGQDELARFVAHFDVFLQEGQVLEFPLLEDFVRDFVEGERDFAVFVDGVEVVHLEVAALLGIDDFAHQLYGGVVLARVFVFFLDGDDGLADEVLHRFQLHVVGAGRAGTDAFGLVADNREAQFFVAQGQGVFALGIGLYVLPVFVGHVDKGQGFAGLFVCHGAGDALCRGSDEAQQADEQQIYLFTHSEALRIYCESVQAVVFGCGGGKPWLAE